jgi:NADP-dependent 3-hydroxy acid dehydrogenase YdfG
MNHAAKLAATSAAQAIALIFWSCTLPRHLNINRLSIMPVVQAFSPFAIKRG